jgi:hypothetical protein
MHLLQHEIVWQLLNPGYEFRLGASKEHTPESSGGASEKVVGEQDIMNINEENDDASLAC